MILSVVVVFILLFNKQYLIYSIFVVYYLKLNI